MAKKVYIVGAILGTGTSEYGHIVDLKSIADGAIGMCVAFSNKKKAKRYAGKHFEIITTEIVKPLDKEE